MKRLLLLFAAILMASTGLWAETVSYRYPVYNTEGFPTDGIKEWKTAEVNATVVTSSGNNVTWGKTGETTWYVVTGTNVTLSEGVICKGDVRLILADGAKFTAKGRDIYCDPGIQVSGDGNSLTIYGQTNQTGQLIANGDVYGAGIGGGNACSASNITINGGMVTAEGATYAAGIGGGNAGSGSNITINGGTVTAKGGQWAAGIGGGINGSGSNITINGGTVTANGGDDADAIGSGSGDNNSSDNIFVATWCIVKADGNNPPTTVIENTDDDLASIFAGKQYATVETPKYAVTYGDNITASFMFASGAEIDAGTPITFTAADRTADGCGLVGFYEESTFDTPITTGVNGQTYTVTVTDAAISVYARYNPIVSYVYPIYNAPNNVTNGIKEWKTGTVIASEIASSEDPVTWGEEGKTTWYVVTGNDVILSKGAICAGNVNLILADGAKLTAKGRDKDYEEFTPGIQVSGKGNSLVIYGQETQSGQLIANGGRFSAGIGGGEYGSGSNITINGGTVTAEGGGNAAGIGGGQGGSGSYITINGGTVTATATGYNKAAGIGGGLAGSGSNITINGGTVTANGGKNCGAGIGGGSDATVCGITINGGIVTANGGNGGTGIGNYKGGPANGITVATSLSVKAGDTEETAEVIDYYRTSLVDFATVLANKRYVTIDKRAPLPDPVSVIYIDENGEEKTASAIELIRNSYIPANLGTANATSWYVVKGSDVQFTQGAICSGAVNLILADEAKLTATGAIIQQAGIQVSGEGNSITIYGQAAQSGQLIANGGANAAGIGGGGHGSGSNITINGGKVTATGGQCAAGIGGGGSGSGSNITINGGTVTANGGLYGAGIGGGQTASAFNITINGGTVTANGYYVNGIGSGDDGPAASDIKVATILTMKAGDTENLTDVIANTGGDLASILAGKQFVTITDKFNITANQDPNNTKHYYSTFYSSKAAYKVPEGVTAYTGVVEGNVLRLTAIADGVIPAGEAVILRLTSEEDITATKQQFDLTAMTTTATKSGTNALTGTDVATTLSTNDYALSLGQNGVGFYLWNGKSIDAHKAYLTLDGAKAKAFTFMFDDGETTAIEQPAINGKQSGDTYNLNGMRVNDSYKGIVIKNGKKIFNK